MGGFTLGDFDNPTKVVSSPDHGFIVEPDLHYGEPFYDEKGNKIDPGTLDGPNYRVFLGYKDDALKTLHNKYKQCGGNVDTWVSAEEEKPATEGSASKKRRYVVSVYGPPSRYWNFDSKFDYYQDRCDEIAFDGMCAGVAPYPVLGACQINSSNRDETGEIVSQKYIVAICIEGAQMVAYCKPFNGTGVTFSYMKDNKSLMKGMATAVPNGWTECGRGSFSGDPIRTPWFFSSDGKQAKATKWMDYTFSTGAGSKTQKVPVIVSAAITPQIGGAKVSFSDATYEGKGFAWKEWLHKKSYVWTDTVSDPTFKYNVGGALVNSGYHSWQYDPFRIECTFEGELVICVDYDFEREAWVEGVHVVDWYRSAQENFTVGVDPQPTFNAETGWDINNSNYGAHIGIIRNPPTRDLPDGSCWVAFYSSSFIGIRNHGSNEFHHKYWHVWNKSGTKAVASGEAYDPDDPELYFMDTYNTYLRYLDLRSKAACGQTRLHEIERDTYRNRTLESVCVYSANPWDTTEGEKFKKKVFFEKTAPDVTIPIFNGPTGVIGWGYQRFEDEFTPGNEVNFTYERTDHNGSIPTDNEDESIQMPSWNTFFHSYLDPSGEPLMADFRIVDIVTLLSNFDYDSDGIFLSSIKGDVAVKYKYNIEGESGAKEADWVSKTDDKIADRVGYGKTFNPAGVT